MRSNQRKYFETRVPQFLFASKRLEKLVDQYTEFLKKHIKKPANRELDLFTNKHNNNEGQL